MLGGGISQVKNIRSWIGTPGRPSYAGRGMPNISVDKTQNKLIISLRMVVAPVQLEQTEASVITAEDTEKVSERGIGIATSQQVYCVLLNKTANSHLHRFRNGLILRHSLCGRLYILR